MIRRSLSLDPLADRRKGDPLSAACVAAENLGAGNPVVWLPAASATMAEWGVPEVVANEADGGTAASGGVIWGAAVEDAFKGA